MKEKWPILDQNHGLTPLEKCQYFDFLNFFFLLARKEFFFQNIIQHVFLAYIAPLPPQKVGKSSILDQKDGLVTLEKFQYFNLFLNSLKNVFCSRIS